MLGLRSSQGLEASSKDWGHVAGGTQEATVSSVAGKESEFSLPPRSARLRLTFGTPFCWGICGTVYSSMSHTLAPLWHHRNRALQRRALGKHAGGRLEVQPRPEIQDRPSVVPRLAYDFPPILPLTRAHEGLDSSRHALFALVGRRPPTLRRPRLGTELRSRLAGGWGRPAPLKRLAGAQHPLPKLLGGLRPQRRSLRTWGLGRKLGTRVGSNHFAVLCFAPAFSVHLCTKTVGALSTVCSWVYVRATLDVRSTKQR